MTASMNIAADRLNGAGQKRSMLELRDLRAYYQTRLFGIEREVRAVDDISLRIDSNEIYGLAGESSSGKTTLIKTIAGAIQPPLRVLGGSVQFNFGGFRIDMLKAKPTDLRAIRWRHLSYIMQGSMGVLNPVRRIRQSFIDFAFRHIQQPMPDFLKIVHGHLERLHLDPVVLRAYPHELSGGMRQRVTIALATVCQPEFIIADEPTTALDVTVQAQVIDLLQGLQEELGMAVLLVTHDLGVVAETCDRVIVMYAGEVVEQAQSSELFPRPRHPYTSAMLACLPGLRPDEPLSPIPGIVPARHALPEGCLYAPRCQHALDVCRGDHPALITAGDDRLCRCVRLDELELPGVG